MGLWKQNSAETIISSVGQIKSIIKLICWDSHSAVTVQLRAQFPQSSLITTSSSLFSFFLPQCYGQKYSYGYIDTDSPHHHLLVRLYLCSCFVGRRRNPSPSLCLCCSQKCTITVCCGFVSILWLCEELDWDCQCIFYCYWIIVNWLELYRECMKPNSCSWLEGSNSVCHYQPSVQQTGWFFPQIAQVMFGTLCCVLMATPPGFT